MAQRRAITSYIHKPISLSWKIAQNCVLCNLEEKYGRKFSIEDKEAKEILDVLYQKHKEYWGIDSE